MGSWHVISLNSTCDKIGGCGEKAPQVKWLEKDLTANSEASCILAYFHDPLFTCFFPQDPDGKADPEHGIREFVVGTGGGHLYAIDDPLENTAAYNDDTYGVLKLNLLSDAYEWEFVPVQSESFTDFGTRGCH